MPSATVYYRVKEEGEPNAPSASWIAPYATCSKLIVLGESTIRQSAGYKHQNNTCLMSWRKENRSELSTRFFFSPEISEIASETGFLGQHQKIPILFKIIRFSLNFNFEVRFKRLCILVKTYRMDWSSGRIPRMIYLRS
jgi:hypothetical protein